MAGRGTIRTMRIDQIEKHSFVGDHLGPASTVVDLGANYGSFATQLIDTYGCRVLGVEPVPDLVRSMPTRGRLTIESAAITGGESRVVINVNPRSCASVGIGEQGAVRIEVPGITLSDLLIRHNIDHVSLLKVDIEGAEIPLVMSTPDHVLLRMDQITVEWHDFIDAGLREPVRAADERLRCLGFRRIAFSLDNTDVLYLHPGLPFNSALLNLAVGRYKYARGAARFARRKLGQKRAPS